MIIQPGEFWIADILFTDGSASKKRPVLILWLDNNDVVVAAVTSVSPRSSSDVAFADWKSAGLRVASTVRLARLDCLEQSLLISKLGKISPDDANVIRSRWQQQIKPQF